MSQSTSTPTFPDLWGAITAGLCAVHCVLLSVGTSAFAASGGVFDPRVRWLLVSVAAFFATHSLRSERTPHARWAAITVLLGLTALVLGRLLEVPMSSLLLARTGEVLALFGGFALAFGHLASFISQRRASASAAVAPSVEPQQVNSQLEPSAQWIPRSATVLLWISITVAILYFSTGPRPLSSSAMGSSAGLGLTYAEDGTIEVGWGLLAELNVMTGERSEQLEKIVGQRVRVPGYVVPIDEAGTEFLLAPWVGACFHAPTPPPNQLVHVVLGDGVKAIDPWGWDPLWVIGKLEVAESDSPYGAVSYFLKGESTEIYSWDD